MGRNETSATISDAGKYRPARLRRRIVENDIGYNRAGGSEDIFLCGVVHVQCERITCQAMIAVGALSDAHETASQMPSPNKAERSPIALTTPIMIGPLQICVGV